MFSDAGVVNCAPRWMIALMSGCVPDVGPILDQGCRQINLQGVCSWLYIKVKNTLPACGQCQKAFPDTFAPDFSRIVESS